MLAEYNNMIIWHPLFNSAISYLQDAYNSNFNGEDIRCGAILGRSRCGKSTVITEFKNKICAEESNEKSVIIVQTPTKATILNMAAQTLKSIGEKNYLSGTAASLTFRAVDLLKRINTKMLVFDEMQNLIDRDSDKLSNEAADWLRELIETIEIPVVLVGLKRTEHIFLINEQLRGRFVESFEMWPFLWNDNSKKEVLFGVLKALQKFYKFENSIQLCTEDMAFRMYCASGGLIGYLVKIVKEANRLSGQSLITQEHLAAAYRNSVNGNSRIGINPITCENNAKIEGALKAVEEANWQRRKTIAR
ncbi:MAG: TniB family NTP-binding protein [Geobacter sp.]|nr:TniB family NTP-binding protein [Geobacter sp.]